VHDSLGACCRIALLYAACTIILLAVNVIATEETKTQEKSVDRDRFTSIRLRKGTVEMLKEKGRKGESYDDIIKRLLEKRRR